MKLSRWMSIALLMTLVITTAAAPAPAQTEPEPDWGALPYFQHTYGGWMRIWTNETTFDKGVREINSSPSIFGNPYPGPTTEEYTTEFQVLWAPTCKSTKAQTFKTSREIYLPGTADKLETSLGAFSQSTTDAGNPIKSVKLLINGTPVHELKKNEVAYETGERFVEDISDAPLHFGKNTITFIGKKKKTKASAGWCTGDNYFGILGEIYGEFLADMTATHTEGSFDGSTYVFEVEVKNNGPSDLIDQFGYTFSASALSETVEVTDIQIGATACSPSVAITQGSKEGVAQSCPLFYMESGDSFEPQVIVSVGAVLPGATVDLAYGVLGYGESEPEEMANNGQNFTADLVP